MPITITTPEGIAPDPTSRESLVAALQFISDSVAITDTNGIVLWVNSAFSRLTGVSFQNAIGKELLGLNAGVHPPELLTGIWAKVLAGECWQGVVRNRDAAGAAHRRQHRISPVRDPLGRVSQVVVVTSGAGTESVEQLAHRQATQLQLLFDEAPIPYHQLDHNGRITRVNHAECALLGFRPEEMIGRPVWELVAPEEREGSRAAVLEKLAGELPLSPITRSYPRADGTRVIVEIHEKRVEDESGRTTGMLSALIDMTTRMRFERALAESNARYEGLFDNSSDGIFIIRVTEEGDFLIEAINPAYEAQTGLSNPEVEGRSLAAVLEPEVASAAIARYRRCVETGEPLVYEDTVEGPRGNRTYFTQLFPVRDSSGRFVRLAGISRDTTERREMERRLRESEEQLRLVLEGNLYGVWDWHIPSGHLEMSRRCLEMLGYEPGEIAPDMASWTQLVHPDDRTEPVRSMMAHFADQANSYDVEMRMRAKSGEWVWVLSRGKIVARDARGRPLRALGTHSDVTKRKTAEMALRDSEDRFRGVVSALAEGIIVRDANGVITSCNAAACQILGRPESELKGRDASEWICLREDGSEFPDDEQPTAITLQTGKALLGVVMGIPKPGGDTVWISVNSEPLIRLGETTPYGVVASFADITELRKTIHQLEEARRVAESATRAKSDFLAMMSHEIRTPMNGVLGMCDLLLSSGLAPEQRSFAYSISESAQALLAVINDILDISKIEAGRLELEHTPFNLRKTLEAVVNLLLPVAQRKGLRLVFGYGLDVPDWFVGDGVRMRQIITNLVGNAVKFTDSGEVSLEVAWDGAIRMTVSDTGIGISEQDLPKLFSKFVQAGPVTRSRSGTGLGLAICRQLLDRMGGSVEARSSLGKGSTFVVRVPLPVSDPALTKPAAVVPVHNVQGASVLLVDDNSVNQRVGVALLLKLGCVVATASDGGEAIALAAERRFDAILMDCKMPKMDGYEATREIRKLELQSTRTPIIALTASAMEEDRRRCEDAGMDDYLTKPIQLDVLSQALSRWVQPAASVHKA